MKKLSLLICCVLILQILCSCSAKKEDFKKPVNFYYYKEEITYNSPDAVLQPEIREGYSYQGNVVAFLHAYLTGPLSNDLRALIPADVYLVSCEVEDTVAKVVLSSQFSKLSGIKLTAACSALLLSLHDYAGVDELQVSAKDAQLNDKDVLMLTMDDVVLMDTSIGAEK